MPFICVLAEIPDFIRIIMELLKMLLDIIMVPLLEILFFRIFLVYLDRGVRSLHLFIDLGVFFKSGVHILNLLAAYIISLVGVVGSVLICFLPVEEVIVRLTKELVLVTKDLTHFPDFLINDLMPEPVDLVNSIVVAELFKIYQG